MNAVAVVLLHSWKNPKHDDRLRGGAEAVAVCVKNIPIPPDDETV